MRAAAAARWQHVQRSCPCAVRRLSAAPLPATLLAPARVLSPHPPNVAQGGAHPQHVLLHQEASGGAVAQARHEMGHTCPGAHHPSSTLCRWLFPVSTSNPARQTCRNARSTREGPCPGPVGREVWAAAHGLAGKRQLLACTGSSLPSCGPARGRTGRRAASHQGWNGAEACLLVAAARHYQAKSFAVSPRPRSALW